MSTSLLVWCLVFVLVTLVAAPYGRWRLSRDVALLRLRARPGRYGILNGFGQVEVHSSPYIQGDTILIFDRAMAPYGLLDPSQFHIAAESSFDRDRVRFRIIQEETLALRVVNPNASPIKITGIS